MIYVIALGVLTIVLVSIITLILSMKKSDQNEDEYIEMINEYERLSKELEEEKEKIERGIIFVKDKK